MQLPGHWHAEIAKRIDIAATAIYHGMTIDAVSGLDLSCTPAAGQPWDAIQMATQARTMSAGFPSLVERLAERREMPCVSGESLSMPVAVGRYHQRMLRDAGMVDSELAGRTRPRT
jgi:hypothetical protein